MILRKITCPNDRAEGDCNGVPYTTDLVNINGVNVHFWLGGNATEAHAAALYSIIRKERDIVTVTYSDGAPRAYWGHYNVGTTAMETV